MCGAVKRIPVLVDVCLLDFFGYRNMCWEDTVFFFLTAKNNFRNFQFQVVFGMTRFQNIWLQVIFISVGNFD